MAYATRSISNSKSSPQTCQNSEIPLNVTH
jgi:hypothetical protein